MIALTLRDTWTSRYSIAWKSSSATSVISDVPLVTDRPYRFGSTFIIIIAGLFGLISLPCLLSNTDRNSSLSLAAKKFIANMDEPPIFTSPPYVETHPSRLPHLRAALKKPRLTNRLQFATFARRGLLTCAFRCVPAASITFCPRV
jgi:hypothetical protein